MRKIMMVIRREYLQSVTKKSFWIGTLAFPLVLLLIMGLAVGAHFLNHESERRIAFIDETGQLAANMVAALNASDENKFKDGKPRFVVEAVPLTGTSEETRRSLEQKVLDEEIHGILVARQDLDPNAAFGLYLKSVGDEDTGRALRRALQSAVVQLRLERSQLELDRATLDSFVQPIELKSFEVKAGGEATEKDPGVAQIGMLIFSMILYITLFIYGFATARGIIQEKSSRVMEVLLGSMSHNQLITGKILGIAAVSLTQMIIYAGTAWAARLYIMLKQDPQRFSNVLELVAPGRIIFFLVFFLLGYFLYTSMFAIVGAVSNTEQDAQNLQTPVVMLLMIPYIMSVFFVKHPDSAAAVAASFFPPFTPMVMFMRISVLTPPFWQIALSIVLMLAAIWFMFRMAAKIFRIGSLMHGKRPTIPEILRWARS